MKGAETLHAEAFALIEEALHKLAEPPPSTKGLNPFERAGRLFNALESRAALAKSAAKTTAALRARLVLAENGA